MKGWPIQFHATHSNNIQLSHDRCQARRLQTFCNGICFSNRNIQVHERVYLRFVEVSTSWSGVVRFGFTSHDPATVGKDSLPRYACPDLTNKPGYWAKALPERFALRGNVLLFYVNHSGDVVFGVNGEEKGVFFGGVATNVPLWALVDIYGNTTAVEFIDGRQLNNLASLSTDSIVPQPNSSTVSTFDMPTALVSSLSLDPPMTSNLIPASSQSVSLPAMPTLVTSHGAALPVRHYGHVAFFALPFHETVGRNVCVSADRTIAVRRVEEYCNSYVFTQRPLQLGEKVAVQILSIDYAYTGGLAFGMTSCDPNAIQSSDLPDDSDLLLDRPEYWVVNKDVCSNPEVGDELSFGLTDEGEIRYGRNGVPVSTLMHVDTTLPMWAFFDIYGNTQKIKILGVTSGSLVPDPSNSSGGQSAPGLTVLLPPAVPRSLSASPSRNSTSDGSPKSENTPPPRPPPPRSSPSSSSSPPSFAPVPLLPPKQPRPVSQNLHHHGLHNGSSATFSAAPAPVEHSPPVVPPHLASSSFTSLISSTMYPLSPFQPPAASTAAARKLPLRQRPAPAPTGFSADGKKSAESIDNANNECTICFEKPTDCVLYTCGHMCLCYECALDIKRRQGSTCPICRQPIKDIIKIYRS